MSKQGEKSIIDVAAYYDHCACVISVTLEKANDFVPWGDDRFIFVEVLLGQEYNLSCAVSSFRFDHEQSFKINSANLEEFILSAQRYRFFLLIVENSFIFFSTAIVII